MQQNEYFLLDEIDKVRASDDQRLIYADWLEEQADKMALIKSRFVRLEVELQTTYRARKVSNVLTEMRQLAGKIPSHEWKSRILKDRAGEILLPLSGKKPRKR